MRLGVTMKYLFLILAVASGCKPAASIPSGAQINDQFEAKNAAFYAKDENSSAQTLSLDLAGSDALLKDGLQVFRETLTSVSNQPANVSVSFTGGNFLLETRIHESGGREDWKVSKLNLALSRLEITHEDGSSEDLSLVSGAAQFSLSAGEAVGISWIAQVNVENALICPYYSNIVFSGILGSSPVVHQSLEGSSLTGSFKRTIDVGASSPLVDQVESSDNQIAGVVGAVQSADLDFGCNGILQSMN